MVEIKIRTRTLNIQNSRCIPSPFTRAREIETAKCSFEVIFVVQGEERLITKPSRHMPAALPPRQRIVCAEYKATIVSRNTWDTIRLFKVPSYLYLWKMLQSRRGGSMGANP